MRFRAERVSGGRILRIYSNLSVSKERMVSNMINSNNIDFSEITPQIHELAQRCVSKNAIDPTLYTKYQVNRGLRDLNGKGVLTGLTEISEIQSSMEVDGQTVSCEGKLFYRGVNVEDIVAGFLKEKRFGFEETVYLLLFGDLPTKEQLDEFTQLLARYRSLPPSFVRDVILKAPSSDMMNTLARSVLTLYSYDNNANDISIDNVLRQCLQLIASFPLLSVYGYHAYNYYHNGESLFIHNPLPELSTAENILRILRPDSSYTELEAKILDLALVLHAEHGGGNNSTFTTHVVSSSGTDTYSTVAASLGSLKGPKHGGANHRVMQMMECVKEKVKDWKDEDEVEAFLEKIVRKEEGDHSGLIYGQGHAIYTLSDPRAVILKTHAQRLAKEKGMDDEFALYQLVEKLAPKAFLNVKGDKKVISANVDFYSGLVYKMLGLPEDLYTPMFAVSRIAGWCAHRIEEVETSNRIIRPAYKSLVDSQKYIPLDERK